MKAASFEFTRPASLPEAFSALDQDGARILAGGQSLGPMLNFRVVQPRLLVQVNHLPELGEVSEADDAITLGACVTHATIAAGCTPDLPGNVLARVAGNIAYQAVRNRGTIGGSLSHADPAADWVTVLTALGAVVLIRSATESRSVPVELFVSGPFSTALVHGEMVVAVRVPKRSPKVGWGFVKACRKPGEFAHAMAAAMVSATERRLVIGAMGGKPLLLTGEAASVDGARAALVDAPGLDAVDRHMQLVIVHRALQQAGA